MFSGKSLLIDTAMILALILIGVVGYKLSPLLMPRADLTLSPEPGCDLHTGACFASLPTGGRLTFSLAPRPVLASVPLEMQVDITAFPVERVSIDFAGVEMNMGFYRPTLAAAGNGRYAGRGELPACVTGRMRWQATVLLETADSRVAVPFRFESGHGS